MIIYEVNLKIQSNILPEYRLWLDSHIEKMMQFEGFYDCKIYTVHSNKDNHQLLSIHYYIENMKFLNLYLNKKSQQIRLEGIDKFSNSVSIERRILLKE